jgi:hypothetical protein
MRKVLCIAGLLAVLSAGYVFYGVFLVRVVPPAVLYAAMGSAILGTILLVSSETGDKSRKCTLKGRQFLTDPRLTIRPKSVDRHGRAQQVIASCALCAQSWTFNVGKHPPFHPL